MFEKIRNLKNKKGFTLVELIVVLVILAILAALLVPALTGYIDKANKEKYVAATRQVVVAAQTEISEVYATDTASFVTNNGLDVKDNTKPSLADIKALSEVGDKYTFTVHADKNGKVTKVELKDSASKLLCTYENGTYTTVS